MNVSTRLERLPPYLFGRLNAIKYEKRKNGIDIIDLGMGNPNDPTPPPIVDKLCEAVRDPRNHRYSSATGLFNLRREIAVKYERDYGVALDPDEEVVCVIGSKEGLSHLCLGLLGAGDTTLVPNPTFPVHIYGPALAGANVISVPIRSAHHTPPAALAGAELICGKTDTEDFLKSLINAAQTLFPQPKVLILNFPHNPTTTTVDVEFFEEVVEFARKRNIIVIHDFAYSTITFDGYKAPSFLQVKGVKQIGVEFNTMSKAYNMAGWRVGFCVGNRHIIQALSKVKAYYDYGIFQPVQIATIIAMRHCKEFTEQQALTYQKRRDVLCEGLNRIGWKVEKPKGSMFVWARIPEELQSLGSVDFAMKLMDEAEVSASPGRGFGEYGEGYVRFALVENELRLKQAVRQIGRFLRKVKEQPAASLSAS